MADKVDPFDVEALEKSLNDSATRVSAIWVTFLTFGLYLVIAAGTVTHKQLFLADPIKLPVLNIDLPLAGFFFLAPILFVIFHAYVLLQVLLLGRTAATYNNAVDRMITSSPANAAIRQRLANTLFAQIFAGSPRERDGWLGFLLKAMAWITLAIAPVLILFVFQFQFLPYHSGWVTWAIRILIVIDLIALLFLWPVAVRNGRRKIFVRICIVLFGALVAYFSWFALTFPGESPPRFPVLYRPNTHDSERIDIDCRTTTWLSNFFPRFDRLYLPRVDVVDDEALKKIEEHTKAAGERDYQGERTRLLRNRDFNCADFSDYADLRRVDLTNASLRGASFNQSKLQGVLLREAQLQGTSLYYAELQGASFDGAQLQGASLDGAQLQGASFDGAQLQGASLDGAQLQGASFESIGEPLSERISLNIDPNLQGTSLRLAQLQGTSFRFADLRGASLDYAGLQGSFLLATDLARASLKETQLQGATLVTSKLTEANIRGAGVWRASLAYINCGDAHVQGSNYDATIPVIPWNPFEKPKALVSRFRSSYPV